MKLHLIFAALLLTVFFSIPSVSRSEEEILNQFEYGKVSKTEAGNGAGAGASPDYRLYIEARMEQQRVKLYECVIISLLAVCSLITVLFFITKSGSYSASHIVNASGLVFIIFGAVLLALFAATDQQLTATVGILGAVAGYLFSSMRKDGGSQTK